MKSGMLSNADGVLENKRRRQKWKRLAGVLGCLVMIGTTYVLMRPAETLERELICELLEHTHNEECYANDAARHIRTEEVAALIDALPSPEEAEARMAELLAAEDTEGYDAYCAELARQVERAGAAYETLTDEQRAQLNTDRLTALHAYLPAKVEIFTLSAPATESGIVVTIFGKTTSFPCPVEELTLAATEVEDESANALRDQALEDEELTAAQNYMCAMALLTRS